MTLALDLDITIDNDSDRDLFTAIAIGLLSHGRAKPDDDVQDPTVLGGWWGDAYPDVEGDQFGSRLWTLQGRGMPVALELAPGMVEEACAWAVEDGLILGVETLLEVAGPGVLALSVRPTLADGQVVDVLGPWYISV